MLVVKVLIHQRTPSRLEQSATAPVAAGSAAVAISKSSKTADAGTSRAHIRAITIDLSYRLAEDGLIFLDRGRHNLARVNT